MEQCYTCAKFLQDTDPNKAWCTGSENCYKLVGFPEYEPKNMENSKEVEP